MKDFFQKYFLVIILSLALVAGLAWPAASQGLASFRHIFLFVIMFFVGLEQSPSALVRETQKIHLILISLTLNYLFFSLLSWSSAWLFFRGEEIFVGFAVLGAVPVTLTSAVIFTRLDKGNDRLALVIVFVSQVISILVTPVLLGLFAKVMMARDGDTALQVNMGHMMGQLLVYFLLPLFLGMLARRLFPLDRLVRYLTRPEQIVIALFVFVGAGQIPRESPLLLMGKTVLVVLLFQMVLSVVVREFVKLFPAEDQTSLFYTATQKTLPAGLYLILNYFPAAAILPMVFYHLAQLTMGRLYWLPPQTAASQQTKE